MGSIGNTQTTTAAAPRATAANMTYNELQAYIRDNNLTRQYNMMINNRQNASYQNQLNAMRDLVTDNEAVKNARLTADERNARELARVERENRNSGLNDRNQLKKGETYTFDWGSERRTGTYTGTKLINGTVVNEFKLSNGKITRIEDEDIRRMNFKKKGR